MSFHPLMVYDEAHFHKSERATLDEGEPFTFTPERRAKLDEILTKYPPEQKRSAVLAALYLAQEQDGYLTANAMRHVAPILNMTPAEVEDVATYYVMFFRERVGTYVLQVCRTLSCALSGAERVTEALSEKLGIKVGETDPSGMFTLLEFECLGACDRAPILNMTPAEVEDVATYYVMFFRERVGKYVLQVCRTLSCALSGAERVTEALSEKLGITVGETDPSGMFTLLEFECLGACDRAPIVMVNNEHWHEKATPESCAKLVDDIKARGADALSGCHLCIEKR